MPRTPSDQVLLEPLAAARRLRVTPELLMGYAKHGAKGRGGRRLALVADAPGNRFTIDDLDAFDAYLSEPWAPARATRPPIPSCVRDYLKVEAGGGCARCLTGTPLEEAHIEPWETSRSHHHHNLIRLCRNCHRSFDEGVILRAEIERIKTRCVDAVQRRLSSFRPRGWPIPGAPATAAGLEGRDEELAAVVSAVATGGSVLIEGTGGIGKTQLALSAMRSFAQQRPVVWLDVEALGDDVDLSETLRRRSAEAGLAAADDLAAMLDEGRACVVIDGVERLKRGCDELVDLLEQLAGATFDTVVLVTSQVALPSFQAGLRVRLRPLGPDVSRRLLLNGSETIAVGTAETEELLRFAHGHPLTLGILSALLRHFASARDVLSRLDRHGSAAVAMPGRRTHGPRTSLELSLAVAFDDLDARQRRLLWAVAMSPAGFRRDMHPLDELDVGDAVEVAAELRAWNLIEIVRDPWFEPDHPAAAVLAMLSPIRAFVLRRMAEEPADQRASRERAMAKEVAFLASWLQHSFVKNGAAQVGLALLERELPNAVAMFEFAYERRADEGFLRVMESLANSTMMVLFTTGRFRLGQRLMRRASAAVAEAGRSTDAMHLLLQMQVLAERSGDDHGAAFALAEAERVSADAAGEGLAMVRQLQASAAESRRDYTAAAKLAREALALFDELEGEHYQAGFAAFQLGRALEFGGDPEAALPCYRRAIETWRREDDPINLASTLHHVGNCEAYAGRWRSAMDAYREAADGFVELGTVDYISNALGEAGLILPFLELLTDLPARDTVRAGLHDCVSRIVEMHREPELIGKRLRVSLRKLGGVMSVAVHTGNADLLEKAADAISSQILIQMVDVPTEQVPDNVRMLIWHVQWLVQLCAFLSVGIGTVPKEDEVRIIAGFAARGFAAPDHGTMAPWLASFMRRLRGVEGMNADRMRAELDEFEW